MDPTFVHPASEGPKWKRPPSCPVLCCATNDLDEKKGRRICENENDAPLSLDMLPHSCQHLQTHRSGLRLRNDIPATNNWADSPLLDGTGPLEAKGINTTEEGRLEVAHRTSVPGRCRPWVPRSVDRRHCRWTSSCPPRGDGASACAYLPGSSCGGLRRPHRRRRYCSFRFDVSAWLLARNDWFCDCLPAIESRHDYATENKKNKWNSSSSSSRRSSQSKLPPGPVAVHATLSNRLKIQPPSLESPICFPAPLLIR